MDTNFTKPINSQISPVNPLDPAKILPPNAPQNLSCNFSDCNLPESELYISDKNLSGTKLVDLEFNLSEPCQEIENQKAEEEELDLALSLSPGLESKEVPSDLSLSVDQEAMSSLKAMQFNSKPKIVGAGLENLGNTCFLNVIMQCFTHTTPLLIGLVSCRHKFPCNDASGPGFCVICALIEHINLSISKSVFAPFVFVNNLKHFSNDFEKSQQEDAHEFLQCFLDKLEICWNKSFNTSLQENNLVKEIFGGGFVSKLRCCNCSHFSDSKEQLIDVSLEIDNANSLPGALESFTKVEKIEYTCENCKEQGFMKQLMLDQAPSIAAFHLKRFKNDGLIVEKIDKFVSFPLELDLRPYTADCDTPSAALKYELYAVVVHVGTSPISGHYYCFIRSEPNIWYKLDDDQVTCAAEEYVLSHEAYILFYAKKGTPSFSKFVKIQKKAMDMTIQNTSPKSVLDNVDGYQRVGQITIVTADIAKPKESSINECENKENFIPVSTPCVTTSSPVVLPLIDSDSILKEINSSHVPEVIYPGNVTPPPMLARSLSLKTYKSQQYSIPKVHSKSADQISCKKQLNRELESVELKQACKLIKKRMPGSRGEQLLAALGGSLSAGSASKKRSRTNHHLPNSMDNNYRQKGTNQSNAAGIFR